MLNLEFDFNPMWTSLIAANINKNPSQKKRFLDEYERDLDYRKAAKKLLESGNLYGLTKEPVTKQAETLKITAVIQVLVEEKYAPQYSKLIKLFGREYAVYANYASDYFCGKDNEFPPKIEYNNMGEYATFVIYSMANPEGRLPQNESKFEKLMEYFAENEAKQNRVSDKQKIFIKNGMGMSKSMKDVAIKACDEQRKLAIRLLNGDGQDSQMRYFEQNEYGAFCSSGHLFRKALRDAGISNAHLCEKIVSKQKFSEAQRAVADSVFFSTPNPDNETATLCASFTTLISEGKVKIDEDGSIVAKEDVAPMVLEVINTYNSMLSTYLMIRSLGEMYVEQMRRAIGNEIFPEKSKSNEEALVKKIDELERELEKSRESEERALEAQKDAEQKLIQSKKRENALSTKLETAYREIDELMERVPEQNDEVELPEVEETSSIVEESHDDRDYAKELDEVLEQKTVAIVGGNENLMKKFQLAHPNAVIVWKDEIGCCDQAIRNADVVMFKVDSLSHALYGKCKTICQRYDVPMGYIPNITSVARMEESMCNQLTTILG